MLLSLEARWDVPELYDPKVELQCQTGVLQRSSGISVRLCPGAIARLVKEMRVIAERGAGLRGTVVSGEGAIQVVDDAPDVKDDDFVILHMSDLHASEEYAFRLPRDVKATRKDKPRLENLLRDDVRQMGLEGRADALDHFRRLEMIMK